MEQTRIFIVDDHPIVKDGLKVLINHLEDMTLCEEADDIKGALKDVALTQPDVMIT